MASVDGQTILHQIDEKKSDLLACNTGLDLVEGGYYGAIAFDYLIHSKLDYFDLFAGNYLAEAILTLGMRKNNNLLRSQNFH